MRIAAHPDASFLVLSVGASVILNACTVSQARSFEGSTTTAQEEGTVVPNLEHQETPRCLLFNNRISIPIQECDRGMLAADPSGQADHIVVEAGATTGVLSTPAFYFNADDKLALTSGDLVADAHHYFPEDGGEIARDPTDSRVVWITGGASWLLFALVRFEDNSLVRFQFATPQNESVQERHRNEARRIVTGARLEIALRETPGRMTAGPFSLEVQSGYRLSCNVEVVPGHMVCRVHSLGPWNEPSSVVRIFLSVTPRFALPRAPQTPTTLRDVVLDRPALWGQGPSGELRTSIEFDGSTLELWLESTNDDQTRTLREMVSSLRRRDESRQE